MEAQAPALDPCVEARELRASVSGLASEGRLGAVLHAVRRADRLCGPPDAATRVPLLRALAELRRDDEARELALTMLGNEPGKETASPDAEAARAALAVIAAPAPRAELLRAELDQRHRAGDGAGARRALERWVGALERERHVERRVVLAKTADESSAGVTWSDDGRRVAVARDDDLCVLEGPTWAPARCLDVGARGGKHMHFTPDGAWLVAAGDEEVRAFELATGKQLGPFNAVELTGEYAPVWFVLDETSRRVAWPATRLAAHGGDVIVVLDLATGRSRDLKAQRVFAPGPEEPPPNGPPGPMLLDFDATGRLTVSEWSDHSVRVHDAGTGREMAAFRMAMSSTTAYFGAFQQSPDGHWLAWVEQEPAPPATDEQSRKPMRVGLYDLVGQRLMARLRCQGADTLWGVRFSPDSSVLGTAGETFCAWRTANREPLAEQRIDKAALNIAFSPDGELAILHADGGDTSRAVRTRDGSIVLERVAPLGWGGGGDGQRPHRGPSLWLGARDDGRFDRILHVGTGGAIRTVPVAAPFQRALATSRDGSKLLTWDEQGYRSARTDTGALSAPVRGEVVSDEIGVAFGLLGDGSTVARADHINGAVTLWSMPDGTTRYESPPQSRFRFDQLEIGPDYSLDLGGAVRLVRHGARHRLQLQPSPTHTPERSIPVERPSNGRYQLPFGAKSLDDPGTEYDQSYDGFLSPDERTWALQVSMAFSKLILYRADTRQRICSCPGSVGGSSAVFSPDSKWVAVAGGKITFWRTADCARMLDLFPVSEDNAGSDEPGRLVGIVARAGDGRFEVFGRRRNELLRDACRVGPAVVPFEACHDALEEPGLVAEVLAGP